MVSYTLFNTIASLALAAVVNAQLESFGVDIANGGTYYFNLASSAPFSFKGGFSGKYRMDAKFQLISNIRREYNYRHNSSHSPATWRYFGNLFVDHDEWDALWVSVVSSNTIAIISWVNWLLSSPLMHSQMVAGAYTIFMIANLNGIEFGRGFSVTNTQFTATVVSTPVCPPVRL
jgi:hypothetical protein